MYSNYNDMNNSLVRQVKARVELHNSSSLVDAWTEKDRLISVSIERVGDESKFFGFGVCQRANIHLIDTNRELGCSTSQFFKIFFKEESWNEYADTLPAFYVSQNNRDENTNELSVTAYDRLYKASNYTVDLLPLTAPYTLGDFADAAAQLLGLNFEQSYRWNADIDWSLSYEEGANFEGTETVRVALDYLAEATQTVYYVDNNEQLVFRRFAKDAVADLVITKPKYITLVNRENRRLGKIEHITALSDNAAAGAGGGTTQYIRDNPFWNLRDDVQELVDKAYSAIGLLTINQFDCIWRGDIRLEVGDKIGMIGKDNEEFDSYIINDTWKYDGTFQQSTSWGYSNSDSENEDTPTNLGEIIRQTYAKVDKVNGQIELVTSLKTELEEELSSIRLENQEITATVEKVIKDVDTQNGIMNDTINSLAERVDATVTSEDVNIQIQQTLANGVDEVTTKTGFKFNADGLTISKSGTEMTTQITEDGMVVYRDDTAMLTANHIGVEATNLHATTYLMIGTYSRFEDFEPERTGCFWMGVGGGMIPIGN